MASYGHFSGHFGSTMEFTFFFHLSEFFFLELMTTFILLPLHICRAEARRKSGQIDLMWPDLRPKNPFQKVIVAKALHGQRYPMPLSP